MTPLFSSRTMFHLGTNVRCQMPESSSLTLSGVGITRPCRFNVTVLAVEPGLAMPRRLLYPLFSFTLATHTWLRRATWGRWRRALSLPACLLSSSLLARQSRRPNDNSACLFIHCCLAAECPFHGGEFTVSVLCTIGSVLSW